MNKPRPLKKRPPLPQPVSLADFEKMKLRKPKLTPLEKCEFEFYKNLFCSKKGNN
jgi:hypothetical protein